MSMADNKERDALVAELRECVRNIRRKPTPLSEVIPLLIKAIDALSAPQQEPGK